jgi:membrane-associated phospholipid phosphatase
MAIEAMDVTMGRRIYIPPSNLDIAVAKTVVARTSRSIEQCSKAATLLADEKVLLAATAGLWALSLFRGRPYVRRVCSHFFACAVTSAVVPHIIKALAERERPDRTMVHGPRHAIPRSGNPMDSFPSGHALHIGAFAVASRLLVPRVWQWTVWFSAFGLASTRIVLLAHWLSDVLAGLVMGVLLERGVDRISRIDGATEEQTFGRLADR